MDKNVAVFEKLLRKHVNTVIKPSLAETLGRVADWMVGVIDGDFQPATYEGGGSNQFPIWEGQLRDSTGVGVYVDGAMTAYKPTAIGRYKQASGWNDASARGIVGTNYLDEALAAATTEFSTGVWIVLFSTVPYAYHINTEGSKWGRGEGFFNALEKSLKDEVFAKLQPIKQ